MWSITKTTIFSENGTEYETYGISKGSTTINDITLNKDKIETLVRLLNELDLSEAHASDVVEDFMAV